MSDPYLYSVTKSVATFSINDAPWNLMSIEYIDRLEEQLPDVLADDSIRAMVFTGEGLDHFSAGMNLKQLPEGIKRAGSPAAFFGQRHRVLDMIENGGTPAIATLFGYCLGGGLELPLACHFRIAAKEGAQIGLPEMDLGSVPAWGGSARLPRAVGRTYALDMILRGRKIDGDEAYRIGLVTELVPVSDIKGRAQSLGEELAAQPRLAVKSMLDVVVGFETRTLDESMAHEMNAAAANSGTADAAEGMLAFMEKRKPVFNRAPE
ncbi:MAG: enoyl-CoA hydratase-related protein [Gammaproteobacteria bacterium]|nr:enoyl-CoA hydratase-related protein [Gammaproteobacteria bacterium]